MKKNMESIIHRPNTKAKVSSVLNRDTKSYGKQCLLDSSQETCWSSDQGTPQQCTFDLNDVDNSKNISIKQIKIMFQGGFAGKKCSLLTNSDDGWNYEFDFYPQDSNDEQVFEVATPITINTSNSRIRIVFHESTDFYGRITIYKIDVLGTPV